MKKLAIVASFAALSASSFAVLFSDAVGDVNMPGGYFANQDISGVDVTHTAGSITFKINIVGDINASDWGKYGLMIDTTAGGTAGANPWNRSFAMTGTDFFVGSWVDGGSGSNQLFSWTGSGWSGATTAANVKTANSVSYTYSWAQLGIGYGSTICFDAWSSGGSDGDSAWDLLSKNVVNDSNADGVTGWQEYTTSGTPACYTIPVPEPTGVLALGLGVVALLRRKKA